jgi:superfamily I DNA/RNA helicase
VVTRQKEGWFKLWGPPGTGKTWRMMTETRGLIEAGYLPERISLCSFTNDAADEIRMRLSRDLEFDKEQMRYVGTIHAQALKLLGWRDLGMKAVYDKDALERFFRAERIRYKPRQRSAKPETTFDEVDMLDDEDEGSYCIAFWDWYRSTNKPNDTDYFEQEIHNFPGGLLNDEVYASLALLERFVPRYETWKTDEQRWDFSDLLAGALEPKARTPEIDVLIVDECQDLSPLLWDVINHWSRGIKTRWLAGDPNQAIYVFQGAEPERFATQYGDWVYLDRSYRLEEQAVQYALQILRECTDYAPFPWFGIEDGTERELPDDEALLFRTGRLLRDAAAELRRRGVPYRVLRGSRPLETKHAKAVRYALELGEHNFTTTADLLAISDLISQQGDQRNQWLLWGTHDKLEKLVKQEQRPQMIGIGDLDQYGVTSAFATLLAEQRPWDAFRKVDAENLHYYREVFRKYGLSGFTDTPRLTLSTIHRTKGREWSKVQVMADWAIRPFRALHGSEWDAEHRVAYVAVTRARARTVIVPRPYANNFPFPLKVAA